MKFKKVFLISLIFINIGFVIKILIIDYGAAITKQRNVKVIKYINNEFDDAIRFRRYNHRDKVDTSSICVNVNTKDNKNIYAIVSGKIVIDKIGLEYPILEGSTVENLNISITKFYGSPINSIGNCVLAGHNKNDGSLFGRLREIKKNDKIVLYDNSGNKKEYNVFNIKVVAPTDVSILSQETNNSCWVTLITCANRGKNRLIIQGKEI